MESKKRFALNGLSVHSLELNQDGELKVTFDLPYPQTTAQYETQLRGLRTLNVYKDKELLRACKRLFGMIRDRVMEPDPERLKVNCDTCATSNCCRNYNVLLMRDDIERLAEGLGLTAGTFRERYTVPAVDWSGDYEAQLACDKDDEGQEKCVFLKPAPSGQLRCTVYELRPEICRDFDMKTCDDYSPMKELVVLDGDGREGVREAS